MEETDVTDQPPPPVERFRRAREPGGAERIRIAVAQTPITTDPRKNGAAVRAAMHTAADRGARLVHFSEGALGGYAGADKAHFTGWHIDWQPAETELHQTMQLAEQLRLWVVVGGNHRLEHARPHNSLYVVSDHGELADRYDKRYLSHSEITGLYTPGFTSCTFTVDGYTFGCLLCVEIQFGELWIEQRDLGVDCVLFSTYSDDPIFETIARGYAAANSYWVSVAVPAPCSTATPSAVIGPHGQYLAQAPLGEPAVICVDLNRSDPALDIALNHARPWRRTAATGGLYTPHRSTEPRSTDHTTT
ncbi:carbon-nitrogen hydrolase family protein [Actinoplanes sp. NPDC026619]|uniref:carbon-nitrogen hydrolase family protein n=1 Tax=Actinoplanes sp. NPDC026619 TaxID=3155798 RepID=UPI00340CD2AE